MTYRSQSKNVSQQSHFHWIAERDYTGQLQKRSFTHDITAAILCKTHNDTAAMFVYRKILRELFSCKNVLIPPKNLHSCWPREGKRCIPIHCNWLKNHGQPFSTNQKKTKIHRYHMITNDSYNRSLGSIKMVQRSHHYCFDFRGFRQHKHRNTPRGKPLISRVLKWKKLFNERSDRCNEEAKIDFCSILSLVSKWSVQ